MEDKGEEKQGAKEALGAEKGAEEMGERREGEGEGEGEEEEGEGEEEAEGSVGGGVVEARVVRSKGLAMKARCPRGSRLCLLWISGFESTPYKRNQTLQRPLWSPPRANCLKSGAWVRNVQTASWRRSVLM